MSGDWEINVDTPKKATHFSKIGAYAGFVWCAQIVISVAILVFFQTEELASQSTAAIYIFFSAATLKFLLVWFLAWRVYSGKGYISAIILLTLFVASKGVFIIFMPLLLVGVLFNGFIAYAMYAGVLGTIALKRYQFSSDAIAAN